jgi:hypothetical protein
MPAGLARFAEVNTVSGRNTPPGELFDELSGVGLAPFGGRGRFDSQGVRPATLIPTRR